MLRHHAPDCDPASPQRPVPDRAHATLLALTAAALAACGGTPPRATSPAGEREPPSDGSSADASPGDADLDAGAVTADAADGDAGGTVDAATNVAAEGGDAGEANGDEATEARMPVELETWLPAHGLSAPLPEPAHLPSGEPAYAAGCYEQQFGAAGPLGLDCSSPHEVAGHWEESFHTFLVPDAGRMRIAWHGPLSAEQMYDEEGDEPHVGLEVTFSDDGAVMTLREDPPGGCATARAALAASARHWEYDLPVARVRRFIDDVCATQGVYNRRPDGRYAHARAGGGATPAATR